uniref:SWIM-type domain-containing protein n=1 Tax=Ditylenchus dipsaci TaxID=166011 RepID=A0A915DFT8_9BILA
MTRNWKSVASCENEGEFLEWKATNASWMKTRRYYKNRLSAKGINTKYRCGHNHKYNFGYDCKAEMRLRRPSNFEIVCIQVSGDCDHSKVEERKLDSPVKEKLQELESYGGPTLTATQMQKRLKNSLDRSKHELPSPKHINDFVRHESMKAGQLVQMKLSDLKNYASQNSSQPGNLDEPYVVSFKVSDDRKQWVVVWTTKRLTNAQIEQSRINHLQIDATYKLLYQDFPYFPVGFSDANKKFYCSFTALCSGETTWCYAGILLAVRQVCSTLNAPYKPAFIMTDADTAIESAIREVWGPEVTHALCKFHVAKNFERYLPKAKLFEKQKHQMKEDFRTICAAQSTSIALVSYWVAKYANAQRLLEAVEKFKQQWLDRHCFRGWYDSFVPMISTNNGLERLNLEIKCNCTFRERLSLPAFLNKVDLMLNDWSSDLVNVSPSISPNLVNGKYQAAYDFWKLKYISINESYVIQSSRYINNELDVEDFNELVGFEADNGWEKYVELRSKFYFVQPSTLYTGFYKCSCFNGLKDNICKHALSLMCKDGLFDYPEEVTDAVLGGKRNRGENEERHQPL